MRVWEFKGKDGYTFIFKERLDGKYDLGVTTLNRVEADWSLIDDLKDRGLITFDKTYEI